VVGCDDAGDIDGDGVGSDVAALGDAAHLSWNSQPP
jgi:hypothetical protein